MGKNNSDVPVMRLIISSVGWLIAAAAGSVRRVFVRRVSV